MPIPRGGSRIPLWVSFVVGFGVADGVAVAETWTGLDVV